VDRRLEGETMVTLSRRQARIDGPAGFATRVRRLLVIAAVVSACQGDRSGEIGDGRASTAGDASGRGGDDTGSPPAIDAASSDSTGQSSGASEGGPPDDASGESGAPHDANGDSPSASTTVPTTAEVLAVMRRVADYQIAAGPGAAHPDWVNKWPEAVFYSGVMATYRATSDAKYLAAATQWGQMNQWTLLGGTANPPTRSADNQCAGQTYGEIYLTNPQASGAAVMVQNTQGVIDAMIANPSPGHVDWWWCDALFMAPPVVARLGAVTSQGKYYQFLDTMWSDATSSLFDPARGLFWRDSTFVQTTTYWSRGNGWVMGGIARVLDYLPLTDASRASYVTLLQTMAAAVAPLQGTDGLWRSDLLHPATYPNPETSGTSLFCYAMAWGIHHGALDRATYLPVVLLAWQGLVANVDAQGRLGYVQGTGSQPAAAAAGDSFDYGAGAFLLAGSEVAQL
jgi:unsaturated rhamnogalacturonyl hydrolase